MAQPSSTVPANIRAANTLDRLSARDGIGSNDLMYGIPLPPGKVIGDTYLDTRWHAATLMLFDQEKMLNGYPVRYDIKNNELEIKAKNGIKVISGDKIKSFVWVDSLTKEPTYFVNANAYQIPGEESVSGFYEVVSEGEITVLKRTFLVVKKANYVVQFDMGSKDDHILKKQKYYYLQGNTLIELPSSRKKLVPLFGSHASEMSEYIKQNALSTSEENHIQAIFDHYNALVKS